MILGNTGYSARTVVEELERRKAEIERELNNRSKPLGVAKVSQLRQQLQDIERVLPPTQSAVMA